MKNIFLVFSAFASASYSSLAESKYKPIPTPLNVRVTSSQPRQIVWTNLTPKQQELAKHLINASNAGKALVYNQNHRHALLVKSLIEKALASRNSPRTKTLLGPGYLEFLNYAAK